MIAQGQVNLAVLPGQEPEEVGLAVGGVLCPEGPDRGAAPAELGGAHAVHPAEGAALLRAEAGVEAVLTQGLSRLLRVKDIAAIPAEGHGAVLPHQTGDGMRKGKLGQVAQGGNVAQIALLRDARPIDLQALDKIAVHGNPLFLRYAIKFLEYITPLFICIGINAYGKQAGNRPESLRGAHCLCA